MTNGTSHRKADAAAKRGILLVRLLRVTVFFVSLSLKLRLQEWPVL